MLKRITPSYIQTIKVASAIAAIMSTSALAGNAYGQDEPEIFEEVYVTGSMIKRSEADSTLPIQYVSQSDIKASGISSTAELMEKLPVMQGFVTASDSVGGGGGGLQTASLRGLGSEYTLVLLNGHRMAPADSGSSIDLSGIPVSAIERVEVLSDGASALYGSDAIAGVVNFILKKDFQGIEVGGRFDMPEESGGEKGELHLTGGFGDYSEDGFNIMVAFSHESQSELAASDREFAETGIIYFDVPGYNQQGLFFNGSLNAIPGNARVYYTDDSGEEVTLFFSPYQLNNDGCPAQTTASAEECSFDYTSTIQILPEQERNSLYTSVNFKITDAVEVFATALLSQNKLVANIAPYPTGFVRLYNSAEDTDFPDLVMQEVMPLLTASEADGGFGLSNAEVQSITAVDGRWRALPAGTRQTEYITDSYNLNAGIMGQVAAIDFQTSLTHAYTNIEQNYPSGWLLADEFMSLVSSGDLNIFAGQDQLTDTDYEMLAPTVYDGNWDNVEVKMTMLDANGVMPLFEMNGGEAKLGIGMDFRHTTYTRDISEANQNAAILFLSTDTAYDFSRKQYGIFAELNMPITSNWDVNTSVRYDEIGGVKDKLSGEKVTDSMDDTTYKISTLWAATDEISLRASYGTGFKSPTLRQLAAPREEFGVTGGNFTCPFPVGDPLRDLCVSTTGTFQAHVYREGFADLEPETSEQWSAGVVLLPGEQTTVTVDYWELDMDNLVDYLTDSQIFADPEAYRQFFDSWNNPGTGDDELAIIQAWQNVGSKKVSGIDWSVMTAFELGRASLDTKLRGTYVISSESSLTGSSLGRYGEDEDVVFRNIIQLTNSLIIANTTQNLIVNFRSGYQDSLQYVTLIEDDGSMGDDVGVQLRVPSYTTIDYNFVWSLVDESLDLTFGISNLLDNTPPLSLRTGDPGHQVGWDPRYADAYGRTFFLSASYDFLM